MGKNEKRLYALYTKSRTEKKAERELVAKNIETYLPLEKKLKQWSDRKKWVHEPLIRSYIFVRVNQKELYQAYYTPGIVTIVNFEGKPAPIPDKQIEAIKMLLKSGERYEVTSDFFEVGETVEIQAGGLKGFKGELVQQLNRYKVLLRIDVIQQNLLININPSYLKKVAAEK
ncbi:MAG: UpxY family transcription antiterminator [Bacteroidales bacterium]